VNPIQALTTTAGYLSRTSPSVKAGAEKAATPEKNLQSVFTEVVQRAGRVGYASVEATATAGSLEEAVGGAWEQWYQEVGLSRYNFEAGAGSPSVRVNKTSEDLKQDYKKILVEATQQDAYRNPIAYLTTLSADELRVIQQVQSLADPIEVTKLSDEGAMNLLLPPDTQIDFDKDGLTRVGIANSIRFPDSNKPLTVRDAWEQATVGLSEMDRALYSLQMSSVLSTANMKFDAQGNWIRSAEPGDADWMNPMNSSDFSYFDFVRVKIENMERFKGYMSADQYQSQMSFWTKFRDELGRRQPANATSNL
jgi:hypothetical protein